MGTARLRPIICMASYSITPDPMKARSNTFLKKGNTKLIGFTRCGAVRWISRSRSRKASATSLKSSISR